MDLRRGQGANVCGFLEGVFEVALQSLEEETLLKTSTTLIGSVKVLQVWDPANAQGMGFVGRW